MMEREREKEYIPTHQPAVSPKLFVKTLCITLLNSSLINPRFLLFLKVWQRLLNKKRFLAEKKRKGKKKKPTQK